MGEALQRNYLCRPAQKNWKIGSKLSLATRILLIILVGILGIFISV